MRGVVGDRIGKKGSGGGAEDAMLGEADSRGYRRPLPGFSTNAPRRSANDRPPQSFSDGPGLGGAMDISLPESDTRRLPDLGIALKSILAFWLLYMALITMRAVIAEFPDFWGMFARRAAAAAVGSALTFLVYLAHAAGRPQGAQRQGGRSPPCCRSPAPSCSPPSTSGSSTSTRRSKPRATMPA